MSDSEIKTNSDDYKIPDYTASHFGKHYWLPEVNLTVYDYSDIVTKDAYGDYDYFKAIEAHETSHKITGQTGLVMTRMYYSDLAWADLFSEKKNMNDPIICAMTNDVLYLESRKLQEAFACFLTDVQISHLQSDGKTKHDKLDVNYLETLRDEDLQDKYVKKLYDKLHDLWEWSKKDDVFVSSAAMFAFDIPYVAPTGDILTDERLSAHERFELLHEQIRTLANKSSLDKRHYFSEAIKNNKLFDGENLQHFINLSAFALFSYLTNQNYGNKTMGEEQLTSYRWTQFDLRGVTSLPIVPEKVKKYHRDRMDAQFGEIFRKFFFEYLVHFWMAGFKLPEYYIYLPNYRYTDSSSWVRWYYHYWMWLEKEWLIEGKDLDLISRVMNAFVLHEDNRKDHKEALEKAYKKIDFSKVDPLVEEDFRKTSKLVNRQLRW